MPDRESRVFAARRSLRAIVASTFVIILAARAHSAEASDGAWSEWFPPSAVNTFHLVAYDPTRQQLVVIPFDGATSGVEYWTLALSGSPQWTRHATGLPAPAPQMRGAFIALDTARDRLILAGGWPYTDSAPAKDVWALSLASETWSKLALTGTGTFNGAAGVYDPVADRIVAFQGWIPQSNTLQTAQLSMAPGSGWTNLLWEVYPQSSYHTAVYDPVRRRMLIIGGNGTSESDPLAIHLASSAPSVHLGAVGTPPPTRLQSPWAVYDSIADRVLVGGGYSGNQTVWALSLSGTPTWSVLTTVSPLRTLAGAVFDPVNNRVVMFGGSTADASGSYSNECWALNLDPTPQWEALSGVVAPEPLGREGHSALADPVRDRMLVFGGLAQYAGGDLFSWELWARGWSTAAPWQLIPTVGPAPAPRDPIAYDAARDRLLGFSSNTVVALPLPGTGLHHWVNLAPTGVAPASRSDVATAWDPLNDRMLVFGGSAGLSRFGDLWSVNLTGTPAWTKIPISGPAARSRARFVMDSERSRVLLLGGSNGSQTFTDVWQLSLGPIPQWTPLAPLGAPPAEVSSATIDTSEDRVLVLSNSQIHALALEGTPAWSALSLSGMGPGPRIGSSLVYDHARRQAVLYGGRRASVIFRLRELWSVEFEPASTGVVEDVPGHLRLAAWPNPARDYFNVSFTLASASSVRLTLTDIAGRHVREIDSGELAAGARTLRLDAGSRLRAGLYFVTLRTAEGARTAKVVIAE